MEACPSWHEINVIKGLHKWGEESWEQQDKEELQGMKELGYSSKTDVQAKGGKQWVEEEEVSVGWVVFMSKKSVEVINSGLK